MQLGWATSSLPAMACLSGLSYQRAPIPPPTTTPPGRLADGVWRVNEGQVDRFRPDVVYAHHAAVNGWLAKKLNEATGLPFVVTDHDFGEVASCRRFPHRYAIFSEVCERASMMVTVASRMERELRDLFPAVATRTVQNGTDPIPAELLSRARNDCLSGKIVLFSCGHFYECKQFPFLVSAFAEVAQRHPRATLRIAGEGETRRQVENAIKELSLEGRVQVLGRLQHQEVLIELASSDAFVLLSRDEPFATVFSEAASAGKPIVLCNDGGFCDVFESERHGIAVPPNDLRAAADALDRILSSPEERARMGEAARELFETRLRWDHNAAAMVEIFEQAIRGRVVRETARI